MDSVFINVTSSSSVVGGWITEGGRNNPNYDSDITNYSGDGSSQKTNSDKVFASFDLDKIPSFVLEQLQAGTVQVTLKFTTYTTSIVEKTIHVYAGSDPAAISAVQAEIANPSTTNAATAYNYLAPPAVSPSGYLPVTMPAATQVATIDVRKGVGPFSSDENQNAGQVVDITSLVLDAVNAGRSNLLVWFYVGGTGTLDHYDISNLSVNLNGLAGALSTIGVAPDSTYVTSAAFSPFSSITLNSTIPEEYTTNSIPFDVPKGSSTNFIDQSTAFQSTNTYLIVQSNAASGTLSGPGLQATPLFQEAGQRTYLIDGTDAEISAKLRALVFTPSTGTSGQVPATTFTIKEFNAPLPGPAGIPIPLGKFAFPGSTDTNHAVTPGTTVRVGAGGTTTGNTLGVDRSGQIAQEVVGNGGRATGTTVTGGLLDIQSGGTSSGTILRGAVVAVKTTVSGTSVTLNQTFHGQETIGSGGKSSNADVQAGGDQVVLAGGLSANPMIEAEGTEEVYGTVDVATVYGVQTIYSGGTAIKVTVGDGGQQVVQANGRALNTTVSSGGSVTVLFGGTVSDLTIAGGTAILKNGAKAEGAITFSGAGTLEIDAPITGTSSFPTAIYGFSAGNSIDFVGLSYNGVTTVTRSGSTVTVTNGVATESFRLKDSSVQTIMAFNDGQGGTLISAPVSNTTGGTTANPVAPFITGGRNSIVKANSSVLPFYGVQVSDPNYGSAETITIRMSDGGASGTLSGPGLSGGANGVYTLTGSADAVTAALGQIKFVAGSLQPNSSVTTGFTLSDTTTVGTTATSTAVSVTINTPPAAVSVTGAGALTTVSEAPVTPFATATVTDPNANSTEVLTIKLSNAGAGGVLSGAGLSSQPNGIYTLSGTAAAVTAALRALVFTPAMGTPGNSVTTKFSLSDVSTPGMSAGSNSFSVTNVDPVVAPTLSGAAALAVQSEAASTPFANASLSNPNFNSTDVLTIQLSNGGAGGVLSGSGLAGGAGGTYTLTGTADQVTAALQALVFTPAAGGPNSSVTTTFTLTDATSAGTSASSAAFSVTNSDPAVLPVLTGGSALSVRSEAASRPFATVTLTDANLNSTDTLTIQLSNGGAGGALSGAGLSGGAGGTYALSGTAAAVTAALQALVFTPTKGAAGTSATTSFTLTDRTSSGMQAALSGFSVTNVDPLFATGAVLNTGTVSNATIDATSPGAHTVIIGAGSQNTITYGSSSGTVTGTGSGNTITGGNGVLSVSGLGGGTTVVLGDGNNTVNLAAAGAGNSVVVGNGNNRIAAGNGGGEQVTAGNGANVISAGGAGDVVMAGNGANTVTMTGAGASVTTGSGGDTISILGVGGATIRAGLGTNKISFAGTGNVVVNQGGSDLVTDNGSGNTLVTSVAGSGVITVGANALSNGDVFDLRATMAATGWNHMAGTLSSYLSTGVQGNDATIVVRPTGSAPGGSFTVAVLTGAGPTSLSTLLPHTLT